VIVGIWKCSKPYED